MSDLSLEDAIRIAADGDAVLFVGAGVGFLSKNKSGTLPNGPVLSNRLLNRPDDNPSPPTLDRASGFVIRKRGGVEAVYSLLESNLKVVSVDPSLCELYRLPWRRVYTTNYDDAIEMCRKGFQASNTCTLESPISQARLGTVVHLNGYFPYVSPANLERNLSLSDRSYATRNLERSPWHGVLAQDFERARAIIFVGYSLYDLDIARLLLSANITPKSFFFLSPDVDEIDEEAVALFGQTPGGGALALLTTVKSTLADYTPKRGEPRFLALNRIGIFPQEESVSAPSRILEDQLVYGILPERETVDNVFAFPEHPFIVQREQERKALRELDRGVYRDVVITGEFVSGKSATALRIAASLIQRGYRAYVANHGPTLSEELSKLSAIDDRVIVIFEGYSSYRKTIANYARQRSDRHRLILTEQAVQHELHSDFLLDAPIAGQIYELTLDRIAPEDAPQFAELLDFGGYWGARAGNSTVANARHIELDLRSSLYRLMSEIVESPDVQRRVDELLAPVLTNRRASEVFIAACIVNVLGVRFRIEDWVAAFDAQHVKSVFRNYGSEISYFMTIQSGNVFARSGLLSSTLLSRINDRELLLSAALKIFEVAAKNRTPFDFYDDVYVRLMQFNKLQPIMRGRSERDLIFEFYEKARPISETYKNADFWLQLGIAATALDDLEIAGDAFTNAYAREDKKKTPNYRKIDNYYNRYLLKYAASADDPQSAYELFMDATAGLGKQIFMEDNRHYPFKSGRAYGEIARRHFSAWSKDQQESFVLETQNIREKAVEFEAKHPGRSVDVSVLIKETGELLDRLAETN